MHDWIIVTCGIILCLFIGFSIWFVKVTWEDYKNGN